MSKGRSKRNSLRGKREQTCRMIASSPSTTALTSRTKKSVIATPERWNHSLSIDYRMAEKREKEERTHSDRDDGNWNASISPRHGGVTSLTDSLKRFRPFIKVFRYSMEPRWISNCQDSVRCLAGSGRDVICTSLGVGWL